MELQSSNSEISDRNPQSYQTLIGQNREQSERKTIKKSPRQIGRAYRQFSPLEDKLLMLQISRFGKNFKKIAKIFPKRTCFELKNRYYNHLRNSERDIVQSDEHIPASSQYPTASIYQSVSKAELVSDLIDLNLEKNSYTLISKLISSLDQTFQTIKQQINK